jgi:hypothetical protein
VIGHKSKNHFTNDSLHIGTVNIGSNAISPRFSILHGNSSSFTSFFYESVTNKPNHHDHLSSDKNQIATALIFMPQPLKEIKEKRKRDKRLIN